MSDTVASARSLGSAASKGETFERRAANLKELLDELDRLEAKVRQGGGAHQIKRQHKRGKLTARERVNRLVDTPKDFLELGRFAGHQMYEDEGGCPAGGTVMGVGRIKGRLCMIVANDATVKAGAWFPITVKKNLRAQEIALENHLPVVYLVDSAGVYLPMQDDIFPDKEHFGRVFRNNARLSSKGIPQIAAVMGSCVAGGAYLPIMSDEALIVEGTGSIFLAGPFLVRAAIGEDIDAETLGGATTHSEISGVIDYQVPDDTACLKAIRDLVGRMGNRSTAGFDRSRSQEPAYASQQIRGVFPRNRNQPYDMREVLARIVDKDTWREYKAGYGKTLLCGYARIDGWSVGVVANQRTVVRSRQGEMQVGGVIYSDAADKAARFVMNCNQKRVPLVFVQDVSGFMIGKRAEQGGIIKDGAKLVSAVANSVVPKLTVVAGNSFGAGNYAMCGRAYEPRLICAWPTARIGVMGGRQAAQTMVQIQIRKLQKQGKQISEEVQKELERKIEQQYGTQTEPLYAAARLWVDEIIPPAETRQWISKGIAMANCNPERPPFNPGVIQT